MRKINVRFLTILSATICVLAIGFFLLYRFQSHRRTRGLLTLVEEKEKAKEPDEAITFLARYVATNPKDHAQLKRLALMLKAKTERLMSEGTLDERTFSLAYQKLEAAVRANPQDLEIREATADYMTTFGRLTDAIDYMKELERIAGDKAKPEW
ncbi:MAG TPA: hypothetical protein VIY86_10315 [Pirellulaceae bacterium]